MTNESITPEMIDWQVKRIAELEKRAERAESYFRDMEEEQAAILPEDYSLTDWAAAQRKRIAALEAEVADHDALIALQHERTVEAEREWQAATGNHDVYPGLSELIDWLRSDRDRLRKALVRARIDIWQLTGCAGGSPALDMIDDALSATGQHEHPDTALLNKLERQKLAGESWTLLERAGGGIPYPVADESRSKAIRYQTAREAIAALKEVERG